jgi:hypothetical protein
LPSRSAAPEPAAVEPGEPRAAAPRPPSIADATSARLGVAAAKVVGGAAAVDVDAPAGGPKPVVSSPATPPIAGAGAGPPPGPSPFVDATLPRHADAVRAAADLARRGRPDAGARLLLGQAEEAGAGDHDRLALLAARLLLDGGRASEAATLLDGTTWRDPALAGEVETARARLRQAGPRQP